MQVNFCATLLARSEESESSYVCFGPNCITKSTHRKYNAFGKTYLFDVEGYHLREEDPGWEVSYVVDAYHAGNVS